MTDREIQHVKILNTGQKVEIIFCIIVLIRIVLRTVLRICK